MSDWSELASQALPVVAAIAASVITYIFTSRITKRQLEHAEVLASRQDQAWIDQQWWQRKADKYDHILELLWKNLVATSEMLEETYGRKVDQDFIDRLQFDFRAKQVEFASHATIGAFYISQGAVDAIKQYNKTYWKIMRLDDYVEQLEADCEALKICLEAVREAASKDLHINLTSFHVAVPAAPTELPSPPQPPAGPDPHPAAA